MTDSFTIAVPPADHPRRCTATAKHSGERCERWAMQGASVCPMHGGRAPQVQAAARRRLVEQQAAKSLADLEYEPVEDPVAELGDITARAKALMHWFESRAAEATGAEAEAALGLYINAAERTARLLETCARLGLAERRVQLEEAQAQLAWEAIGLVADGLGFVAVEARKRLFDLWHDSILEAERRWAERGLPVP